MNKLRNLVHIKKEIIIPKITAYIALIWTIKNIKYYKTIIIYKTKMIEIYF